MAPMLVFRVEETLLVELRNNCPNQFMEPDHNSHSLLPSYGPAITADLGATLPQP
jgi:hypothetical protein